MKKNLIILFRWEWEVVAEQDPGIHRCEQSGGWCQDHPANHAGSQGWKCFDPVFLHSPPVLPTLLLGGHLIGYREKTSVEDPDLPWIVPSKEIRTNSY